MASSTAGYWETGSSLTVSAVSHISGYLADKRQAKYMNQLQAYNNSMVRLSDANNQNAITTSSLQVRDNSARQALSIQIQGKQAEADVAASAAAAGVSGNSVALAMMQMNRGAARAEHNRRVSLKSHYTQVDQQRRNSTLGAKVNQDFTHLPAPGMASYALGFGTEALNIVSKEYPKLKSTKLSDIFSF